MVAAQAGSFEGLDPSIGCMLVFRGEGGQKGKKRRGALFFELLQAATNLAIGSKRLYRHLQMLRQL